MPQASTAAIIVRQNNKGIEILLTLRAIEPFKGQWCIPGGHIEINEPARDAIIREVQEETGLHFDATFFRYFDEIIPPNIHAVVLVFDGSINGEVQTDPDEVTEAKWFSIEKTLQFPLAYRHNEIIKAYMKQVFST